MNSLPLERQFSNLLPNFPEETIQIVMSAADGQFEKFQSLFEIFKKDENLALRISNLVGLKKRVTSTYYFPSLAHYLIDLSVIEDVRKSYTPCLMAWLNKATPSELDSLMKIMEWDLFNLEVRHSGQYTFIVALEVEAFFSLPAKHFEAIVRTLENKDSKNRKEFLQLFLTLQKEGFEFEKLLSLAETLDEKGINAFEFKKFNQLNISFEVFINLKKEEKEKIIYCDIPFSCGDLDHYLKLIMKSKSNAQSNFLQNLNKDLAEFLFNIPEEPLSDVWENYVVRRENWGKFYCETKNSQKILKSQKKYGMLMHHSIEMASQLFSKVNDFDRLLDFIVMRRRHIAEVLSHPQLNETGILKDVPCITYCMSDYQFLADRLWEKKDKEPNLIFDESTLKLTYFEKLQDEKIELSNVAFREYFKEDAVLDEKNCALVTHTSPENAKKIMDYVKNVLYPEILEEKDLQKLIIKSGEIFWWICHAKPWFVGDPSTAEILFRSIWKVKGCPNPPWKKNIIPWVEAMSISDVKTFGKLFHTLFDSNLEN